MGISIEPSEEQVVALSHLRLSVDASARIVQINCSMKSCHIFVTNRINRVVIAVVLSELVNKVSELGTTNLFGHCLIVHKNRKVFKVH